MTQKYMHGISSYQCGVAGKRCGVALRFGLALIRKFTARRARPEGAGLGMVTDSAGMADSSLTSMLCEGSEADIYSIDAREERPRLKLV